MNRHPSVLRQLISEHFNRNELKNLCFDLGIDIEEADSERRSALVRYLIETCRQRGQLPDLLALCRQRREHVNWPDIQPEELVVHTGIKTKTAQETLTQESLFSGDKRLRKNVPFSMSKAGKALYWLFAIIPIVLHIVINLYFWRNLSNFVVNTQSEQFLFWVKFIWFTPVFWVALNFLGLLLGPPQDVNLTPNAQGTWDETNAFLIVSYVSKGVNQDTLYRAIQETRWVLDLKSVNYMIEVVTDIEIAKEKRISATKGAIHYHTVPKDYQTKTKVKYKARALQYLLEQRTNRLSKQKDWNNNDIWILHLDEESVLSHQAVIGIEKFIRKHSLRYSKGAIGQGEILYNSYKYGEHLLFTAIDALRTGDDLGRFRFQYKVLHKPIGGMHGSFILTPAVIEQRLSWDSGAKSQITEDAYFALRAMEKNVHFDWVDGFIKEQSPFTAKDFFNQRTRWHSGLALVVTDNKLKLSTRMVLGIIMVTWSIIWIGTLVTVINLIVGFATGEGFFPYWPLIATSLLSGLVGSIYMIGAYRNVTYWVAPIWKKIGMLLFTYLLFLIQILPIMEGLAIVYTIYRFIFKRPQEFYVVDKD